MAYASHRSSFLSPSLATHTSLIDSVDPRTRIAAAVLFSIMVAAVNGLLTLGIALAMALLGSLITGMRMLGAIKRLVPVNIFVLFLILLLPFSSGQSPLIAFGPVQYSKEGLLLAVGIALKANAIVLWILVLLGRLDIITLGHALRHLGVPEKLTHLLLFTVRYLDVLHGEYVRLRTAMKMRGFRPRVSAHSYRSYGYLVGMLLVRSLDRSERIVAAMKCRGFRGRFYLLDHFAFSRRDVWFIAAVVLVLVLLAVLEWS
jgi:cobalt/nickel transport system permease protein